MRLLSWWRRRTYRPSGGTAEPEIVTQTATSDVLGRISDLDRLVFGKRSFPIDTFVHHHELEPDLLLCATADNEVVGYAMSSAPQAGPAWILSLAVAPSFLRRGTGHALLSATIQRLRKRTSSAILLAVDPDNVAAIELYEACGFNTVDYRPDYLGEGQHRRIMQLPRESTTEPPYDAHLLLGESQSSIDFTNILFVVSFGLLALVSTRIAQFPGVAALLSVVVVATFFSSIYYAVVAGNVARLDRHSVVEQAIVYGNAFSEYLGVMLIVALIPPLVVVVGAAPIVGWIAFVVCSLAFFVYSTSGLDMLGRTIPTGFFRNLALASYGSLSASLLLSVHRGITWLEWTSTGLLSSLLLSLAATHIFRRELAQQTTKIDRREQR